MIRWTAAKLFTIRYDVTEMSASIWVGIQYWSYCWGGRSQSNADYAWLYDEEGVSTLENAEVLEKYRTKWSAIFYWPRYFNLPIECDYLIWKLVQRVKDRMRVLPLCCRVDGIRPGCAQMALAKCGCTSCENLNNRWICWGSQAYLNRVKTSRGKFCSNQHLVRVNTFSYST